MPRRGKKIPKKVGRLRPQAGMARDPDWRPTGPGRYVILQLTQRHRLGPQTYGPGEVRVREGVARELANAEERVRMMEMRFLMPQDVIVSVGYGNHPTIRRVPAGYLDNAVNEIWNGHAEPGITLTGRGY